MSLVKRVVIFDHHNYVRWFSVHIQDLLSLPFTCRQLYQKFERGNFVVQISDRQVSQIHYDQANEQSNKTIKYIKGSGDFGNWAGDELLSRWEIARPKISGFLR